MLEFMDRNSAMRIGRLVVKVAGAAFGVVFSLVATFRDLIADSDTSEKGDGTLSDVIRGGDLNFRTGKFDDGTDPAGWYGDD